MPGCHKQFLLSHRQYKKSDTNSLGYTPPFPVETPTEAKSWRRLALESLLSQGGEYWKLRRISLFEGGGTLQGMSRNAGDGMTLVLISCFWSVRREIEPDDLLMLAQRTAPEKAGNG